MISMSAIQNPLFLLNFANTLVPSAMVLVSPIKDCLKAFRMVYLISIYSQQTIPILKNELYYNMQ